MLTGAALAGPVLTAAARPPRMYPMTARAAVEILVVEILVVEVLIMAKSLLVVDPSHVHGLVATAGAHAR